MTEFFTEWLQLVGGMLLVFGAMALVFGPAFYLGTRAEDSSHPYWWIVTAIVWLVLFMTLGLTAATV